MPSNTTPIPAADSIDTSLPADFAPDTNPVDDSEALAAEESSARRKGWQPKDEYTGDPNKWVDAKTFNERGDKFTRNLQRKIETLEAKIASFEGTKEAFKKFHEESIAKKDSELKAAISALRIQRSQAQSEGDHDAAIEIEDRIEALQDSRKQLKDIPDTPAPTETKPTTPADNQGLHPAILDEWVEDGNGWFKDDPKLRDYAVVVAQNLINSGESLRGRKFLDKVANLMAEEFPRKFGRKPSASSSPRTEPASNSSPRSPASPSFKGKTFRDLPAEDQALCKQFVKEGWTTEKAFLESYFSR